MKTRSWMAVAGLAAAAVVASWANAQVFGREASRMTHGEAGAAIAVMPLTRSVDEVRAEALAAVRARGTVHGESAYVAPTRLSRAAQQVHAEARVVAQLASLANGEMAQVSAVPPAQRPVVAETPDLSRTHFVNGEMGAPAPVFVSTRTAAEVRAEAAQAQRDGLMSHGEGGARIAATASAPRSDRTDARANARANADRLGNGEASM